jgi:hypothetical protein
MAQKRSLSSEEVAAALLEEIILTKENESLFSSLSKENGIFLSDTRGLMEVIRRQDNEIAWLREEITRLISTHKEIRIIHNGKGEVICSESESSDPIQISGVQTGTRPIESPEMTGLKSGDCESRAFTLAKDKGDASVQSSPVDFTDDTIFQNVDTGSDSREFMNQESDNAGLQSAEQISGITLRDLVGGITGDKNYSVFEAAAIAGESESVLLEYINDGVLPALHYKNSFLIRGNDLRQYIMSK